MFTIRLINEFHNGDITLITMSFYALVIVIFEIISKINRLKQVSFSIFVKFQS